MAVPPRLALPDAETLLQAARDHAHEEEGDTQRGSREESGRHGGGDRDDGRIDGGGIRVIGGAGGGRAHEDGTGHRELAAVLLAERLDVIDQVFHLLFIPSERVAPVVGKVFPRGNFQHAGHLGEAVATGRAGSFI